MLSDNLVIRLVSLLAAACTACVEPSFPATDAEVEPSARPAGKNDAGSTDATVAAPADARSRDARAEDPPSAPVDMDPDPAHAADDDAATEPSTLPRSDASAPAPDARVSER